MAEAVDAKDEEPSETFNLASVRPKAPVKTITKGTSASQMTNTTTITTGTGQGGWEMTISDQFTPNGVNYSVSDLKIVDTTDNNRDLSGEFTMQWDQEKISPLGFASVEMTGNGLCHFDRAKRVEKSFVSRMRVLSIRFLDYACASLEMTMNGMCSVE